MDEMSDMSECLICYETEDRDFRKITSKCSHRAVVCVECVNKHIKNQSNEKQILEIPCPTKGCKKKMERHDIKNIATKQVFEAYDELAYKIAIQRIPEFRWCKAPCGAGQIHIGKDEAPIVICEGCGAHSCYKHEVAWHTGQTCKEYDESIKQSDFATADYISRETKGCPGCSIPIEKDGGCDHITCTKCSHEFCWLCLYKHPSHKPTCRKNQMFNGYNNV